MNNELEEINNKIEKGYTDSNFFKIMISVLILTIIIGIIGFVCAEEINGNTYSINEMNELIINENTDNEIIIDYSNINNSYMRTYKGRYVDRITGLNFKNKFFYMKFKKEGKIYKKYVKSNNDIYYTGIEYFLQNKILYLNGKQVQIITGVYQP